MADDHHKGTLPHPPEKDGNLLGRAKEEIEAVTHSNSHHKETHGLSDDIDETTPVDEIKGPSVFQRAKEEIEAVVEAVIHNN